MKKISTNIFRKIDYDSIPESSRPDRYEMAFNAVKRSTDGKAIGLVNEGSTFSPLLIPGKISGSVYVEARNWLVVLLNTGELGYYDTKQEKYNRIYDLNDLAKNGKNECTGSSETYSCSFNISDCEEVPLDYNFWNQCNELHIVFSYNCVFYTVNIDELLNPERAKKVTCRDIKTFKCECVPTVRPVNVEGGGGAGLRNGKYRFCIRLRNKDGHPSNFFNISKEVFVGGDKNIPGEISNEFINIWISGLSCHYSAIELVVIKSIGSGASSEIIDRIDYGGGAITYEYRGDTGREIAVPIAEITTRKVNYLDGRIVKIFDGRAFYAQIKNFHNIHIQRVANQATVGLDVYKVPAEIAHHYPGLQPGERYIFGIVGQMCDGTETAVGVLSDIGLLEQRGGGGDASSPPPVDPGNPGGGLEQRTDEEDTNRVIVIAPGASVPICTRDISKVTRTDNGTPVGGESEISYQPGETGCNFGCISFVLTNTSAGEISVDYSSKCTEDPPEPGNGSSGSNGNITFDNSRSDEYVSYKDLPVDNKRTQEDGYYTDGCVTGNTACEPLGKAMSDSLKAIADALPEDSNEYGGEGDDCIECGDGDKPTGFLSAVKKFMAMTLFGPWSVGNSKNRKNKKGSRTANGLKNVMQNFLKEAEEEEVHMPYRTKVNVNSSKETNGGDELEVRADGDIGGQWDNINIYKVGSLEPKWVDSEATYPMTLNCSGGYVYGGLAGRKIRLLEVPLIKHFESPTVGSKSSKLLGVDEQSGYVFLVGLSVRSVLLDDFSGKPYCDNQPWKVVMMPRDSSNSRVLGFGMAIHTFRGDHNGRAHAVPKHGVNSRELLDRHIQRNGDDHEHEGESHNEKYIYTYLSPDTMFASIPLTATHFLKLGDLRGDGWRHGMYAEATKRVGFFERAADQKGTRQTVNMHRMDFAPGQPIKILGISKAKGDRLITPPRGISMPLLNIARESSVYFELESSIGTPEDESFIADGLTHSGLIYGAEAPCGYLIREMPRQYGSLVGAKYVDVGLYATKGATSASGLVGDSFCGPVSVRRTSYISNRVGDRTFIPSPRRTQGFFRFLGFGDPTAPPESDDIRDPKNKANRYENMGLNEAVGATGIGSVYYPGVLKCLVWFWAQSRVNAHYRQRGDEKLGQVYGGNLGTLYLDSDTPKGTPWEDSWMNRYYKEILRESRFHSVLRPVIRLGVIIGLPIWFVTHGFAVFGNIDLFLGYWIRIAIFLIVWLIMFIWVLTVSRINRMMGLREQLNDIEGGADDENVRQWEDNYTKYSNEYNVGNSIGSSIGMTDPFNVCVCNKCSETDYSVYGGNPGVNNLIYYTPRQYQNTEINAFKSVLEGDYGEMQTHTSQLQKLVSMNNMLYAVTTDGWYRLSYNGNVNYRGVEYLLGNGMALGTPHRIMEGVREGVYGCIDPNSMIITPAGAVFVDGKANTINLMTGSEVKVLAEGVSMIMDNYLDFCSSASCRDQKGGGHWYALGYDPELNRILVTKNEASGGKSWTMSYDLEEGGWISAHGYQPMMYFWDRSKMFSVKDNRVWRHNSQKSKQMFYGQYSPFTVWFNTVKMDQSMEHALDFQVDNIELHTIAKKLSEGTRNRHFTFNLAGWGNSYQMTGLHLLDTEEYKCQGFKDIREQNFVERIRRASGRAIWRINAALKDRIKNVESPILKEEDCSFIRNFDHGNAVCKGGDGNGSPLSDYYLRQMYSLDDASLSDIELTLIRTIVYGNERQE